MKKNRFRGKGGGEAIAITTASGTHTFWTIFKQCDNLDLSLQVSYLGCLSRNPRHAELRRKV